MRTHSRASAMLLAFLALQIAGCADAERVPDAGVTPAASSGEAGTPIATEHAVTPMGVTASPQAAATVQAVPTRPPTSGLVTGVVMDASGAPVSSAAVAVVAGTAPYPEMAAFTAADGSYQWMLGPGTYTLEAHRDGFAPATGEVTLEAGQEVKLDLTLISE